VESHARRLTQYLSSRFIVIAVGVYGSLLEWIVSTSWTRTRNIYCVVMYELLLAILWSLVIFLLVVFVVQIYVFYFYFKGAYQPTFTNHNKHGNTMIVKTHNNPRPRSFGACESVATSHYFRVDKTLLINEKLFSSATWKVTYDALMVSANNISSKGNTAK
jgi:hypothetical protein